MESLSVESHDSVTESHDNEPKSHDNTKPVVIQPRPKKVTFAETIEDDDRDLATPPSPLSRKELVGPFMRHGSQPVPRYRLAMTQLDGVECVVDSTRCEWGKQSSLGDPLQERSKVSCWSGLKDERMFLENPPPPTHPHTYTYGPKYVSFLPMISYVFLTTLGSRRSPPQSACDEEDPGCDASIDSLPVWRELPMST